jgi:hypothetical protein
VAIYLSRDLVDDFDILRAQWRVIDEAVAKAQIQQVSPGAGELLDD